MTTPPYGQPGQQPGQPYGQPAQPGYGGRPGYGQPAQPAYGQPGPQYGQPAYGQPAPPAYGQPAAPQYGGQYGAPGYGQPSYGQPAKKSKTGLIAGLVALLVLAVVAVVLIVVLGGSTVLDQGAVERDVAAQFQEREGVAIDLTCPADMEVEANATYECTGTTEAGEDVTLQITITDGESGAYTWTEPS